MDARRYFPQYHQPFRLLLVCGIRQLDYVTTRPRKSGRAYFLLGNREAYTKVKAFQPVQTDTERIVAYLKSAGIDTTFELVPGDHYQYPEQRLTRSFTHMFSASTPRS